MSTIAPLFDPLRVIRQSRNLRVMRDYARISPVRLVIARRDPKIKVRGIIHVIYADGSFSRDSFASYHVLVDWIRNRRTWRGAEFRILDEDIGYFSKPGVIA